MSFINWLLERIDPVRDFQRQIDAQENMLEEHTARQNAEHFSSGDGAQALQDTK